MSRSPEYKTMARQDYGPPTSSIRDFETLLDLKVTDSMSVPGVSTSVQAVPVSPSQIDPEPDSTNPTETIVLQTYCSKIEQSINYLEQKETDYHMSDENATSDLPVETLSGVMRIDEATIENVSHISYPIMQETEDSSEASYVENTGAVIPAPISSAIVQNVTKLPQNFTLNVDATVGNIATIQNVSQGVSAGGQTLWLPTILATSATNPDGKLLEEDRSQTGVSQIIITSESYVSSNLNQGSPRKTNIVTAETNFLGRSKPSKVQILSNISLPKTSCITSLPQYVTPSSKDTIDTYATSNHVYKLSANMLPSKHLNNSMLNNKVGKNQSLITGPSLSPTLINHSPVKNVSYAHAFTKGTNLNKTLKVNNGANLNALVANPPVNTQCHILSRVVSGPKVPKAKSVNTLKAASKGASPAVPNPRNSRSIKIIQQTGSPNKNEGKAWTVRGGSNCKIPPYAAMESGHGKSMPKENPPHKGQIAYHNNERLLLQSPCGPVLISTAPMATSLAKPPHYVQSGQPPRYFQQYVAPEATNQVSANQHLTAQILHSLSQPKLVLQPKQNVLNHQLNTATHDIFPVLAKPLNQKRIVFGDPKTQISADDLIGMEERPNLAEELMRYAFETLAFVMLDHTYALSAQKQPTVSSSSAAVPTSSTSTSPPHVPSPTSPKLGSPLVSSTGPTAELHTLSSPTIIGTPIPVTPVPGLMGTLTYVPTNSAPLRQQEDDAGSVISSVDERRQDHGGGSDTETAPEGEEEGKTRCLCDFTHDDGYMICCDRCGEWQHVDCMGIDRQNIPETYMCEVCQPRLVDRRRARAIQLRKREELSALGASDSDSSENGVRPPGARRKRLLTVTTYSDTSGSCVTTYNSSLTLPLPQQAPVLPPVAPAPPAPKRGTKKPKRADVARKATKRKLTEKRVKRKKEMMMHRGKFNPSLQNQSHWHESYELAMTNHYSPELRAKIAKYANKLGSAPNMAAAISAHHCTTVPHAGGKILIATRDLKESTSVIELRGKYMLSNQHRPQLPMSGRAGSQKPGPFVFFYRLPKDNTQICIDTRTYGNEARFVRRSCKPNAELQHCIVKGALHVFLVTIGPVQSNTEITVGHDTNGKQPCACGNPKHCKFNGMTTAASRKMTDFPPREKRTRNRNSSSSSPASPPLNPMLPLPVREPQGLLTIKPEKKSPIKMEIDTFPPVTDAIMALKFDEPMKMEPIFKEEPEFKEIKEVPPLEPKIEEEEKPIIEEQVKEEIIEPPKVEVKDEVVAVEPMTIKDLAEIPLPEDKPPEEKPKVEEVASPIEEEIPPEKPIKPVEVEEPAPKVVEEDKPLKPVVARSACHERSTRSSRAAASCVNQDSLDDKTDDSQDKLPSTTTTKDKKKMTREERKMEAIMKAFERMEKAEQRKQEVKERASRRRESDPAPHNDRDDDDEQAPAHYANKKRRKRKGRARTTSQNASMNRHRLNSADSDMVTSGDDNATPLSPRAGDLRPTTLITSAPRHDDDDRIDSSVSEDLGLSSACLLVEAAVGPLENAFKLPKTKKTMANEWVGRSPERTPSPYTSPYRPALVAPPSLENLVRVASTMIGDLSGVGSEAEDTGSPPRTPGRSSKVPKKVKKVVKAAEEQQPTLPAQHSAKKRWLRQAISEESDSPTAESPPNEIVTPLKKRRLARQSLSCDPATVVPCNDETSPNLTSEESPTKDDGSITRHCKMKRKYIDSMYENYNYNRESGIGSDEQSLDGKFDSTHDFLNVNLREPRTESFNMDIRRIIGVPGTEDMPDENQKVLDMIPKPIDVNDNEFQVNSTENKTRVDLTPMEIDTEITPQPEKGLIEEQNQQDENQNDTKQDTQSNVPSAETSGNSSPQRDEEMDDIQKKIHSFHTENIQILQKRNKKPPKEKRKKVNLNFDLNMVDDQISIQLRTEKSPEINGDIQDSNEACEGVFSLDKVQLPLTESIPLPPVESIPLPTSDPVPESIPLPDPPVPETIPLPEEPKSVSPQPQEEIKILPSTTESKTETSGLEKQTESIPLPPIESIPLPTCESKENVSFSTLRYEKPTVLDDSNLTFSSRFTTGGLFSGIFSNINQENQVKENLPDINVIKSAIDKSTNSMESSIFSDKASISPVDELKNVQEILSKVNSMDSKNSVILSGVLKSSDEENRIVEEPVSSSSPVKPGGTRSSDPRLNPPTSDKPKPVRRKLSITEYRKRHKGSLEPRCSVDADTPRSSMDQETRASAEWSSDSSAAASLSPLRLDAAAAAAADELEQRLHHALRVVTPQSHPHPPRGVFDAQPTQVERQRENLSERLRREFGLSLPEDEEARSATALQEGSTAPVSTATEAPSELAVTSPQSFVRPGAPPKLPRLDR